MNLEVKNIPALAFQEYRHDAIFKAYKWDLQAGEQSTISDSAILMEGDVAGFLAETAVRLYHETVNIENALKDRPDLGVFIGVSEEMATTLQRCSYEPTKHTRLMRFDFHPTKTGWAVSEVNSDAIAGFAEAAILPLLAERFFCGYARYGDFGGILADSLKRQMPPGATIAYLYHTHIVEDYQNLRFLGDILERDGYKTAYLSPDNIKWKDGKPVGIDGIVRCFPAELMEHAKGLDWVNFLNSDTPSCNHPIAVLTQSKRLPLVWDKLDVGIDTWKKMLPKTTGIKRAFWDKRFILKPAFGRTGEGINIPGTISLEENRAIVADASINPNQWVAQKMFKSRLFNNMHICIGAFVVDGMFAGFYGRASDKLRIDADASDVPVLVKK